jgi:hypothetical protein
MNTRAIIIACALLCVQNTGCGGSSSNDGVLLRGTIVQGEEKKSAILAHELGEGLTEIEVCALGRCDKTNRSGTWSIPSNVARDSEILFTVKGHGADTSFVLNIPQKAKRVDIEKLLHTEFGDHDEDDHDDHGHGHDTHGHDAHGHDHHGHDHHGHSHRELSKHAIAPLPKNNQLTVARVLIDGMEYHDAHEVYSHDHEHGHAEEHDHHDDHDDHKDEHDHHGHSH